MLCLATAQRPGQHLLLAALQFPLQHLAVVVHRGEITLQVRLVARDSIGEVRVGRAVRERLGVRCGVHCGDLDGCGMEVEYEEKTREIQRSK